jgi:hypothetical protein
MTGALRRSSGARRAAARSAVTQDTMIQNSMPLNYPNAGRFPTDKRQYMAI